MQKLSTVQNGRFPNIFYKKDFMSPDKHVDENDPSSWVAKTKVAPVKFTKWFLFVMRGVLMLSFVSWQDDLSAESDDDEEEVS